jgi:hypothetical protein
MSNRNRTAGNGYELSIVREINTRGLNQPGLTNKDIRKLPDSNFYVFPKLGTSRELSRATDAKKVDITVVSNERAKEFPYLIQAKTSCTNIPFQKLLSEIKSMNKGKGTPVVFYQQTEKQKNKAGKLVLKKGKPVFVVKDEFVILYRKDFIDMMFKIADMTFELKQKEHFEK